ncbi:hypothetical protein BsWGS_20129 [Bradybaena similaris]
MEFVFLVLAVSIATVFAKTGLVQHQVHAIIAADQSVTVADCTKTCDAAFVLLNPIDESINDHECSFQCYCQITKIPCTRGIMNKSNRLDTTALVYLLPVIVLVSLQLLKM